MSTAAIQLRRFAMVCIALVTLCAIASTGLSNYYQFIDPSRALTLNPLNVDANKSKLVTFLSNPTNQSPTTKLIEKTRAAIQYAPIDAQLRGLLGELLFRQGDEDAAIDNFNIALGLSQTETIALQRTLGDAVATGDGARIVTKLDILFRRWPGQFGSFANIIPYLLTLPDGHEVVLSKLRTSPPWRGKFLQYLNRDKGTVGLAYRLQIDLNANAKKTNPDEIGATVAALLNFKEYGLAHRLFLLTLNEADRENYGYLFNSNFNLVPSSRPFDWKLQKRPGVNVSLDKQTSSVGDQTTLTVGFLGKPVKSVGISQNIFLPAGEYELTIDMDADNLKAPKGLFFQIACLDPRRTISKLDIPTGNYRDKMLRSTFQLQDSSCKMMRLDMRTDLKVESFRFRYSGKLSIRNISIRKIAS